MKEGQVPRESETIAARRAVRLGKKIREARERWMRPVDWSKEEGLISLDLALVWLLNLYLVWPFFGTEAFITSYSGPVIPAMAKMISWSGLPVSYAIQVVNIIFFLLFPVTFYVFMRRVSGKGLVAMMASLLVSLPISPFAGIRIKAMFFSVEGPHMASLAVVPLAAYGLLGFLHEGGLKNLVIAGAASALVGLISPFGLLAWCIVAGIMAFSEMLLGQGRLKLMRLVMVLVLTGGLSSFWYNPGFFLWMVTGPMGVEPRMMLSRLVPIMLFSLPPLAAFGYLLFDRRPSLQPLFLATFLMIAFLLIVLVGAGVMPSAPSRYLPELGLGLAFLLGLLLDMAFEWGITKKSGWRWIKMSSKRLVSLGLIVLILGLIGGVVIGRDQVLSYESGVLGFWTGMERGELWLARERFGGGYRAMGYGISGATVLILGMLKRVGGKHE